MRFRRRTPTPLPPAPECHEVGAVLQAYLDGELGATDAELVTEHLEHCERCEIEATTVTRVVEAIRRQRPDLESDALDRLGRFVDELTHRPPTGE
jgi:anti-sigma factor RsiW